MNTAVDTSLAAYEDIKPKAPAIREQVLDYVTRFNGQGVSRTMIAEALDLNEITVGSRLTELLQAGKVRRKGETTASTSGKQEHLYVLGDGVAIEKPRGAKMSPDRFANMLHTLGVDAYAIRTRFAWMDQPEGFNFWSDIAGRLETLERDAK